MTAFWEAVASLPEPIPPKAIEYRVYYDPSNGAVLFYTSDQPEGSYISITPEEYTLGRYDMRVVKGKLKAISIGSQKLVPSDQGSFTTNPDDITIVVGVGKRWKTKEYEADE